MGTKLSLPDEELYRRVDEVLHYIWDPIGISSIPQARDEYQMYLPVVFGQLKSGAEPMVIAKYLNDVVTARMELPPNEQRALAVARTLWDWKTVLEEKYT